MDDDGGQERDDDNPGNLRTFEEYDAEPEEFDPDDLGPEVPKAPEPPDFSDVDVDAKLHRRFWALVAVFNVALIAVSLGLMFAVFRGEWQFGAQLTAAGLVVFVYGYYRYKQAKAELDDGDDATTDDASDAPNRNG